MPKRGQRTQTLSSVWGGQRVVGRSVEGQPIRAATFGGGRPVRLLLGGVHGDEPKGVDLLRRLVARLQESGAAAGGLSGTVVCVPEANPDGYARRRRRNARGVDLNRNFPTCNWTLGARRSRYFGGPAPGSEPETRALVRLIERIRPDDIITVHSISERRFCNNFDGPGRSLAVALAVHNGYPVTETIGYATPGSFGTWAGVELGIATVTLELPSHCSPRQCWEANEAALLARPKPAC